MFFNGVYRLPIWKNIDTKSRNIRMLILGAILYIVVHSFISSKYVENISFIVDNKHYLYYLAAFDLAIVGIMMFMHTDKKKVNGNKLTKKQLQFNLKMHQQQMQQQSNQLKIQQLMAQKNNQQTQQVQQETNQQTQQINQEPTQQTEYNDDISIQLPLYESKENYNIEDDVTIPLYEP